MTNDIWIWVHQNAGDIEDITLGLLQEARQKAADLETECRIVAVVAGDELACRTQTHPQGNDPDAPDPDTIDPIHYLGACGVDRVIHIKGFSSSQYHGESMAAVLSVVMKKEPPLYFLMGHDTDTADLAVRLSPMLNVRMCSRAADLRIDSEKKPTVVRPIANGHLSETRTYKSGTPLIVTFLPNVLGSSRIKPDPDRNPIEMESMPAKAGEQSNLKTRIVEIIESSPDQIDITEADIIVAAGRGVTQSQTGEESMEMIYDLAEHIGAAVAGSRPVIDRDDLPFERQIGQTGKTVEPRLIINCGISGANEYTAGIEKSKKIVAINKDPKARIFQFADLGILGDLHQVLPLLNRILTRIKNENNE